MGHLRLSVVNSYPQRFLKNSFFFQINVYFIFHVLNFFKSSSWIFSGLWGIQMTPSFCSVRGQIGQRAVPGWTGSLERNRIKHESLKNLKT